MIVVAGWIFETGASGLGFAVLSPSSPLEGVVIGNPACFASASFDMGEPQVGQGSPSPSGAAPESFFCAAPPSA